MLTSLVTVLVTIEYGLGVGIVSSLLLLLYRVREKRMSGAIPGLSLITTHTHPCLV